MSFWKATEISGSEDAEAAHMAALGWTNRVVGMTRNVYMRGLTNACPKWNQFEFYNRGDLIVPADKFDAIARAIAEGYDRHEPLQRADVERMLAE